MDELAEIAMTAHVQHGEHSKAVDAACLIRSVPRRETKLELHGYWDTLVKQTKVVKRPRPILHLCRFLMLQNSVSAVCPDVC